MTDTGFITLYCGNCARRVKTKQTDGKTPFKVRCDRCDRLHKVFVTTTNDPK